MKKFIYADADDWVGYYVDGDLKYQGHPQYPQDVIRFASSLDCPFDFEVKEVDVDWIDERGDFPKNLNEVKFYSRTG